MTFLWFISILGASASLCGTGIFMAFTGHRWGWGLAVAGALMFIATMCEISLGMDGEQTDKNQLKLWKR